MEKNQKFRNLEELLVQVEKNEQDSDVVTRKRFCKQLVAGHLVLYFLNGCYYACSSNWRYTGCANYHGNDRISNIYTITHSEKEFMAFLY